MTRGTRLDRDADRFRIPVFTGGLALGARGLDR
jgi:hypothetical protein